jgi:predicted metal-binding membrane protein
MLTGFAMGVMNLIWMGLLTILVCIEKLSPVGERVAGMAAVLLILWGFALSLDISFA